MQHLLGWEPIIEDGNIIGLFDVTGGGAISLEPGGQFELSGAPVETVHQTCSELMAHLAQVKEVARPLGIGFLGLGMTPNWTPRRNPGDAEGPLPHHDELHAEGRHARPRHDVSHLHGADQSRLLLRSRHGEEAARVARAAAGRDRDVRQLAVHRRQAQRLPLVPLGDLARHRRSTRAGMLPWAFEPGMGFERYVDYALDVPMYFVKRGDRYIDVAGSVVPRSPGRQAAAGLAGRARHHLRLGQPHLDDLSRRCVSSVISKCAAPTADPGGACRRCRPIGSGFSTTTTRSKPPGIWSRIGPRRSARNCATTCRRWASRPRSAAPACCDLAKATLALAEKGLAPPPRFDANGHDETRYLRPIQEFVARGITPAEELLEKFHGPWGGSVDPAFKDTPIDRLRAVPACLLALLHGGRIAAGCA